MSDFEPGEMVLLVAFEDQPQQRATFLQAEGDVAIVRVWPIDRPEGDKDGLRELPLDQIRKNTWA